MTTSGANTHPQAGGLPQKKGLQERWESFWHREQSKEEIEEANVQVFASVGWIDQRQLWIFEMVSSLAVILLAFGLVTSQTNVQTHGAILSNNPWMQDVWAWTQNVAIDMSLLGAIIRCAVYGLEKEHVKAALYGLLALLLLFTAFIVSDVEAIYQSLHGLTLDTAWSHLPLVNVELLTSIRSFAIVLLLVAHAVQYINWYRATYRLKKHASLPAPAAPAQPATVPTRPTPQQTDGSDLEYLFQAMEAMNQQNVAAMQAMAQQSLQITIEQLTRVTVEAVRETVAALPMYHPPQLARSESETDEAPSVNPGVHEPVNPLSDEAEKPERGLQPNGKTYGNQIETLYQENPNITTTEIEKRLGCSRTTASNWLRRVRPVTGEKEADVNANQTPTSKL